MAKNEVQIAKDLPNKKMTVTRHFDATPEQVWRAWTESKLLDQWWAPNPWRAETKKMDFRDGGHWLYAMVGPDNSKHWSKVEFSSIVPGKRFQTTASFCDENGKLNNDMPKMKWKIEFQAADSGTKMLVEISFESVKDLETIIQMRFEEGFTSGLGNLEHYLNTGFKIRKEMKTSNKARVTTYLNFLGNTEEAFNFYKKVFKGEFTGGGLQRFGDAALPAGMPPLSEADKKLIIHAELTILGGHVLMATDAPESMGLKVEYGNNIHINLEPETRAETKRLYDAISAGGKITMELQDMFWGAYFGSCTDKYGINWMFNCTEAGK